MSQEQKAAISCQAELRELPSMLNWVQKQIELSGLPSSERLKVELAMEEAIVNIIHYAYPEKKGAIDLQCLFSPGEKLLFVLRDQGKPFNPLLHQPSLQEGISLEERKEGGLGIFLIRKNMDELHYEWNPPYNVLTLVKKLY